MKGGRENCKKFRAVIGLKPVGSGGIAGLTLGRLKFIVFKNGKDLLESQLAKVGR
jgi:hypothetical protein